MLVVLEHPFMKTCPQCEFCGRKICKFRARSKTFQSIEALGGVLGNVDWRISREYGVWSGTFL
jgi:hypothetical protein